MKPWLWFMLANLLVSHHYNRFGLIVTKFETLFRLHIFNTNSSSHPYCKAFFRRQQVPKEKIPGKRVSFDISDVIYFLLNNVVVQKWKEAEKGGHGILHWWWWNNFSMESIFTYLITNDDLKTGGEQKMSFGVKNEIE